MKTLGSKALERRSEPATGAICFFSVALEALRPEKNVGRSGNFFRGPNKAYGQREKQGSEAQEGRSDQAAGTICFFYGPTLQPKKKSWGGSVRFFSPRGPRRHEVAVQPGLFR
eukprot:8064063-Pyramimonas_sp.AAC.2